MQIKAGSERESDLQSQLDSVSASLATSKGEGEQARQQIAELRTQISDLEARLAQEQESFKNVSNDLTQSRELVDKREKEVTFLQGEVAQTTAELEGLKQEAASLRTDVAQRDNALSKERSVSAAAKSQVGGAGTHIHAGHLDVAHGVPLGVSIPNTGSVNQPARCSDVGCLIHTRLPEA